MLWSFCALLGCQVAGELIHGATGAPVPGAVIGLGVLLAGLCVAGRLGRPVAVPAADALLPYLGLFFVPPGVAGVLLLARVPALLGPAAAAILVSSVLALAVAGRTAQALLRWQDRRAMMAHQDVDATIRPWVRS